MDSLVREHIFKRLSRRSLDAAESQRYINSRIARVEQARSARPFYMSAHTSPQNASHLVLDGVADRVKTAFTTPVNFPLMLLGAITDLGTNAQISVGRVGGSDFSNDLLQPLAFAGADPLTTGVNAPRYFEVPEILNPSQQLRLNVKNTAGLNGVYYFIFICERVMPYTDEGVAIDPAKDAALISFIKENEPSNYTLRLGVNFAGGGAQTLLGLEAPVFNQPLLITGIGTNLNKTLVQISDGNSSIWSPSVVPIWAIANDFRTRRSQYARIDRAFYYRANTSLRVDAYNGIRAAYDNAGEIDFEARTP